MGTMPVVTRRERRRWASQNKIFKKVVHRFLGIYLSTEEYPQKSKVRDRLEVVRSLIVSKWDPLPPYSF